MMKRKGFTLVELTVAVILLSVLFGSMYMIYNASIESYRSSSNKSESLESCYILYQKLLYDFHSMVMDRNHTVLVKPHEGAQGAKLSFYIVDPERTSGIIRVRKIVYEFSQEERRIRRNGEVVGQGRFESVQFIPDVGNTEDSPNSIIVSMTAMGRHTAKEIDSGAELERNFRNRMTFIGGLGLRRRTDLLNHPTWVRNPSSAPRR